jgi:hypothetical protein
VINHIQISCGIGALESPMIICEDNAACVAQMQIGYIKTNYMKHISLKLFEGPEKAIRRVVNGSQSKFLDGTWPLSQN